MKLFKIRWCKYCRKFCIFKKRRLNTAFVEEERNWVVCCETQYKELVAYYDELWKEYYASRF